MRITAGLQGGGLRRTPNITPVPLPDAEQANLRGFIEVVNREVEASMPSLEYRGLNAREVSHLNAEWSKLSPDEKEQARELLFAHLKRGQASFTFATEHDGSEYSDDRPDPYFRLTVVA
jgi:hypothetical protein